MQACHTLRNGSVAAFAVIVSFEMSATMNVNKFAEETRHVNGALVLPSARLLPPENGASCRPVASVNQPAITLRPSSLPDGSIAFTHGES